jgi:hypothetical protein
MMSDRAGGPDIQRWMAWLRRTVIARMRQPSAGTGDVGVCRYTLIPAVGGHSLNHVGCLLALAI